jgi:hypothetical protein
MPEKFIPLYDLESLTEPQRQEYLKAVCLHMGVPDNIGLVSLTQLDDGEGPSRLVAYVKRGATEIVRSKLQINVTNLTHQMVGGSIVFTATAIAVDGHQEIATGSKYIDGLTGAPLDDAIMTASTRALRRATLQFIGAGVLDESEINQRKTIHAIAAPSVPTPQPTVQPSATPGKDITPPKEIVPEPVLVIDPKQVEFEADQAKLRADFIKQMNEKAKTENPIGLVPAVAKNEPDVIPEDSMIAARKPKTRKTRAPNKKVDLGPSEPVPTKSVAVNPAPAEQAVLIPAPATSAEPAKVEAPLVPPPVRVPPKLSPDQVKPFRSRLFHLVNDYLEPHGLKPIEGMGNADKMRSFAQIMFPEIANMNQLDEAQWEKYLSTLENKVKSDGPAATVAFLEESIGL